MKKYIYKLTYKNFEIIAGELAGEKNFEKYFEKYFSSFIKLKKFLKEKGISTTKGIIYQDAEDREFIESIIRI